MSSCSRVATRESEPMFGHFEPTAIYFVFKSIPYGGMPALGQVMVLDKFLCNGANGMCTIWNIILGFACKLHLTS